MEKTSDNVVYNISLTLNEFDSFLVLSHVRPDGDAVGSVLGLMHYLRAAGKKVTAFLADPVPEIYAFLPGVDEIVSRINTPKFDAVIVVDSNDVDRLGLPVPISDYSKLVINIDHHPSNARFGAINWVDPEASSTAEMILRLADSGDREITPTVASCLYVGIMTDTGRFQFVNTTPQTLRNCARLCEKGADMIDLSRRIYMNIPLARTRLTGHALANAEVKGQTTWAAISRAEMERFSARNEHVDGIINQLVAIAGVEVAALFHELSDGSIKISLRSRGKLNVNDVAGQFGGGGHINAAGFKLQKPLNEAVEEVMKAVSAAMDSLRN